MPSEIKEKEKPDEKAETKAEDTSQDDEAKSDDKDSDFHDAVDGDDSKDDDKDNAKDDAKDDEKDNEKDKPVKKTGKALSYREAREQKRLEANRIRARDRRKRDKVMWNQMQQKIVLLSQENNELKQRNQMLEAELGRVLRSQSVGGSAQAQARDAHLRGLMPSELMAQQGMPPLGMQRPPMSHLDVLGHGGMPGAGRPGMGSMPGAMPGQGYGDLAGRAGLMGPGGAPLPAGAAAGMSDVDRIRQQQLLDAQLLNQQRMAQGMPPAEGQAPAGAGAAAPGGADAGMAMKSM